MIRRHLEEIPDAARTRHEVAKFIAEPAAMALQVPPRSLTDDHLAQDRVLDHVSEVGGVRVGHRRTVSEPATTVRQPSQPVAYPSSRYRITRSGIGTPIGSSPWRTVRVSEAKSPR
jgi:hypothetical protein